MLLFRTVANIFHLITQSFVTLVILKYISEKNHRNLTKISIIIVVFQSNSKTFRIGSTYFMFSKQRV